MGKVLDLRGLSCPIPLIKTKEALVDVSSLIVIVDEPPAKENIMKFAQSQNCQVECTATGREYQITLTKR